MTFKISHRYVACCKIFKTATDNIYTLEYILNDIYTNHSSLKDYTTDYAVKISQNLSYSLDLRSTQRCKLFGLNFMVNRPIH
jgi:hypothetical protein